VGKRRFRRCFVLALKYVYCITKIFGKIEGAEEVKKGCIYFNDEFTGFEDEINQISEDRKKIVLVALSKFVGSYDVKEDKDMIEYAMNFYNGKLYCPNHGWTEYLELQKRFVCKKCYDSDPKEAILMGLTEGDRLWVVDEYIEEVENA